MFVLGALYRRHGTMLFRHNQFKGSVLQTKNHKEKLIFEKWTNLVLIIFVAMILFVKCISKCL